MFEKIKTSSNVEFDVNYADGSQLHVEEGVLLGVQGESIIFHNGTNRASVLLAALDCLTTALISMGLGDLAAAYLEKSQAEAMDKLLEEAFATR